MRLSILFLYNRIGKTNVSVDLHRCANPSFSYLRLFRPDSTPEPETLYVCSPGTDAAALQPVAACRDCGIVWTDPNQGEPSFLPVLRFHSETDPAKILNALSEVFDFFRDWSYRVCASLMRGDELNETFHLLCEVTPNAWYLADTSFRILTAKKDADLEEMSAIWRFLYKEKHLPVDVVMALSEEGVLSQMNQRRSAYIPVVEPFNMPFVSKSIISEKGLLGRFYLIGVYNRLTSYELEIAEFFGNAVSESLSKDPTFIPTRGRLYDNYYIDLIEGTDIHAPERIGEIFSLVGWEPEDSYILAALRRPSRIEAEDAVWILQIHVLEKLYRCRCFLYKGDIVALFNLPAATSPEKEAGFINSMRSICADYGDKIGMSEVFGGKEAFSRLSDYYRQAHLALSRAVKSETISICRFREIAVSCFAQGLAKTYGRDFVLHPDLSLLQSYDEEHRSPLVQTLRVYLDSHQNIADASRKLFIHRNTLINRLQLIKDLTHLELKDPDTALWLMLSCRMLDETE